MGTGVGACAVTLLSTRTRKSRENIVMIRNSSHTRKTRDSLDKFHFLLIPFLWKTNMTYSDLFHLFMQACMLCRVHMHCSTCMRAHSKYLYGWHAHARSEKEALCVQECVSKGRTQGLSIIPPTLFDFSSGWDYRHTPLCPTKLLCVCLFTFNTGDIIQHAFFSFLFLPLRFGLWGILGAGD